MSAVLSQIFRFLRLVLSARLHYIERVDRLLIWRKKLPNKAMSEVDRIFDELTNTLSRWGVRRNPLYRKRLLSWPLKTSRSIYWAHSGTQRSLDPFSGT